MNVSERIAGQKGLLAADLSRLGILGSKSRSIMTEWLWEDAGMTV